MERASARRASRRSPSGRSAGDQSPEGSLPDGSGSRLALRRAAGRARASGPRRGLAGRDGSSWETCDAGRGLNQGARSWPRPAGEPHDLSQPVSRQADLPSTGHSSLQSRRSLIPGASGTRDQHAGPGSPRRSGRPSVGPGRPDGRIGSVEDRDDPRVGETGEPRMVKSLMFPRRLAACLLLLGVAVFCGLRGTALHPADRTPRGPGHRQRRGDRADAGLAIVHLSTATGRSPSSSTATRPRRSSSR